MLFMVGNLIRNVLINEDLDNWFKEKLMFKFVGNMILNKLVGCLILLILMLIVVLMFKMFVVILGLSMFNVFGIKILLY